MRRVSEDHADDLSGTSPSKTVKPDSTFKLRAENQKGSRQNPLGSICKETMVWVCTEVKFILVEEIESSNFELALAAERFTEHQ